MEMRFNVLKGLRYSQLNLLIEEDIIVEVLNVDIGQARSFHFVIVELFKALAVRRDRRH
jgi:hypothetical protein